MADEEARATPCRRWPLKRQYASPADADEAADSFGGGKVAYKCPYCLQWHVGQPVKEATHEHAGM